VRVYRNIAETVGGTPLLALERYARCNGLRAELYAKLEYFNPAGSVKDRVARAVIEDAEARGLLQKGGTIIEPTSGNTGIGLACMAASKGYRVVIVMPDNMSIERRRLLQAYGAQLVLTDGKEGMKGAIAKAEQLLRENPQAISAGQFTNPVNPAVHYKTTGAEIWEDTEGAVDYFVAGVGTGGTLTGVGRYLKERNPFVKIIAVEPYSSPVLSGGTAGAHGLQGIGAGFVPQTLDAGVIDEVIAVKEEDALAAQAAVCRSEGVLAGISSGAALWAAAQLAKKSENANKKIVVLFPDSGERYLSE
jgi:cysteine synthase A